MKATVLLADSAQSIDGGKVNALGLGWSTVSSPVSAMAVVLFIDLEPSEFGEHVFRMWLSRGDEDGSVVVTEPSGEKRPLEFGGRFETGPPTTERVPGRASFAVNIIGHLELTPGAVYEWRVELDGARERTWDTSFYVRPADVASPPQERDQDSTNAKKRITRRRSADAR